MESLTLKWKHWYWYLALLFNVLIPTVLSINRIAVNRYEAPENGTGFLLVLALGAPLMLTLLVVYMYRTMLEYRACRVIIKPNRFGYFWKGILASFISFNLFLIASLVSYKSEGGSSTSSILIYSVIGISCLLGTISSIFLTMYEFCVNFDIFYNKNKETLIKEYLERSSKGDMKKFRKSNF